MKPDMIVSGGVKYHPALLGYLESISKLSPHPDNPNSGDEGAIVESIDISGMYRPVIAQKSTGYVLAGNTTYAACLYLGADLIPIVWLDVDDNEALRILVGDNQLARLAVMDQGLLTPLLGVLLDTELRLLGTGFPDTPAEIPPSDIESAYTLTVTLTGDMLATWFDLPGDSDRDRLDYLMGLR